MKQDSPWKEVIAALFKDFLKFFFPEIFKDIDFSKGYVFLDKELHQIIKGSKTGKRYSDKLVKVYLRDGSETWLLIHIEIQGYEEKEFPERMYIYNYRIFDKFRKNVISLALLTDDNPKFRPNEYNRSRWGFSAICRFPIVKIIDYRRRLKELESDPNPFAIIVRAYLKTLEVSGNVQKKYSWKKRFLLELYERGMKREILLAIFNFIDWIIELPEGLDNEIFEKIKTVEENKAMSHMILPERIGHKKGLQEGIAKSIPMLHDALATIIEIKYGKAGQTLAARAARIRNLTRLQKLMDDLKRAQSLSEAEKLFTKEKK